MTRQYQRLDNVTDDQIKKAFEMRKRGIKAETIALSTGLTKHSIQIWFQKPPSKLVNRILTSPILRSLVEDHANLRTAGNWEDTIIGNNERRSIPVVDRRGTSTGYSSAHSIDEDTKKATEQNNEQPVNVYIRDQMWDQDDPSQTPHAIIIPGEEETENSVDRKLELDTHKVSTADEVVTDAFTTLSGQAENFPLQTVLEARNLIDLNSKLINYRQTLEDHLKSVNGLLANMETLVYIETLEEAESDYRNKIKSLEIEIERLQKAEKPL